MTIGEKVKRHREDLLALSDIFEEDLYAEAKASAKSAYGAIATLKKAKSDLPDSYAGTKEDVIAYALASKEIDDVIKKLKDEALKRAWEDDHEAE